MAQIPTLDKFNGFNPTIQSAETYGGYGALQQQHIRGSSQGNVALHRFLLPSGSVGAVAGSDVEQVRWRHYDVSCMFKLRARNCVCVGHLLSLY